MLVLIMAAAMASGDASANGMLSGLPRDYNQARAWMVDHGYQPLRVKTDHRSKPCADWSEDSKCSPSDLPEGECAADVPACNFFWRTPSGEVVKVMTWGEERGSIIGAKRADRTEKRDLIELHR